MVVALAGVVCTPSVVAAQEYVVRSGDSLSSIAQRLDTTWPALWRLNPSLKDPNRIVPGMVLRTTPASAVSAAPATRGGPVVLPGMARPTPGAEYTVRPGDSLGLIARRHGLTWAELWLLNPHVTQPDRLLPGARLRVPAWPASGRAMASVTAYGPTGRNTASGKAPARGMAASNTLPFGTVVRTSTGLSVVVEDRIGCCSDLDIFMPTVAEARRFGRQQLTIAW
jgi:LysM repeat protein